MTQSRALAPETSSEPPDILDGVPGAWVVYDHDMGPYAIALHHDAVSAARDSAQRGYGKVGFWAFGVEFADAIKVWEGR
ncbi:hypothetical protein L2K70_04935 [Nocardioides KLBMP 9356]|uniref:Uncharacterized protein n=1 Tax=Nocardioides potassii TaxID=2911371 RepID=A0ABS9HA20_9ACTN|nr:hypothetical protein [Nocardioides potassii]MCF6376941.1 hypothetical protein [Nocardioides potassii]